MRHRHLSQLICTTLVLGSIAAGCGGGDSDDTGAPESRATTTTAAAATTTAATAERAAATFVATDFAFDGPAEVSAGFVDVTIVNEGQEDHHAQLIRLGGSVDLDALTTALDSGDFSVLDAVTFVGGPNGAPPGGERTATVGLDPGSYAVICMIPSADGVAHHTKGMVAPLEVVPPEGTAAPAPDPLTTIHMGSTGEFVFTVPPDLPAEGTVAVVNDGEQVHELVYYPINEGSTFDDVKAYILVPPGSPVPEGPPPIDPQGGGGITGLSTGETAWLDLDLAPGRYAWFCFFPDTEQNGLPHAVEGMAAEVTIPG